MSDSPDISFEHFDPQYELGNIDANGKNIKPRKKPGRKPNPPSPAQRKAQNRAAQRAFRERKRREMREAETTVKHCLYIRDQALGEARQLKTKLEEIRYENNYLKGQLLTLKMACIANRVDVPKLWDMSSSDGISTADSIALSKTKGIPQPMEIFLDKHRNIISLSERHVPSNSTTDSTAALTSLSPGPLAHSPDSFVCSPPSAMVDLHQHETGSLLSSSPDSSYSGNNSCDDILDTNHQQQQQQHMDTVNSATTNDLHPSPPSSPSSKQSFPSATLNGTMDLSQQLSLIAPQLASHLDSPFFQQLLNTDLASGLMNDSPSPANSNNNDNLFSSKGENEQLGMNHWLQQQNLHPKHLAAVVQAISRNNGNISTTPQWMMTSRGNRKDDNDDTPMDDYNTAATATATTETSTIKQEQEQPFLLGSLDDSLQIGDAAATERNDLGMMNLDELMMDDGSTSASLPERDAKTGLERIKTKVMDGEDDHSTVNLLSLSASKLRSAPPMSPLEALQFIRTVKNVDSESQALFKPTELQRMIPHDTRIDHIPGPMMRDLMIIFQDFYNANELFDLLVSSATFLGGDISCQDNWMVAPSFLHQYWFLCPNHRPHRLDNLVDIVVNMGQDMIKMMMERKAMYFERDRFADYFPSDLPSTDRPHHQQQQQPATQQDHQQQDQPQMQQSPLPSSSSPSSQQNYHHNHLSAQQDDELQHSGKNLMTFDAFNGNDFSLDAMMTLVDDSDLFASM